MKKILLILLAVLFLLCSCGRNVPAETTDGVTTESTSATVLTEPEETTLYEDIKVETQEIGTDVNVKYEVLTFDNEELQAILDDESKKILSSYIPNISSVSDLGGTAEYDVKLETIYESEKLISAVFSGSYAIYYENSEEGGEVLYTVNVDKKTGKILATPDIVDYEKMVEAFDSGRFDVSVDFSQYNSAYGIYPYVYVDESRLTVCITKSGMYEEVLRYSISYNDAQDFLKIEEK
ncbi:MAG: hypothetical protein IKU61_01775 [Clostridia bacterium]|nr:hypothetical protein [Clostridia bacterium]